MPASYAQGTVRDDKGEKSVVRIFVPEPAGTVTVTNILGDLTTIGNFLTPLLGGEIETLRFCIELDVSGLSNNAMVANSDVEEGAQFMFRTAGGFVSRIRLPTFLETLLIANSNQVDLSQTAVSNFVDFMDGTTGLGFLGSPTDYREDDIVTLTSALESFRKSRR